MVGRSVRVNVWSVGLYVLTSINLNELGRVVQHIICDEVNGRAGDAVSQQSSLGAVKRAIKPVISD